MFLCCSMKDNQKLLSFFVAVDAQIVTSNFFSEPGTFTFEKRGHLVKESCGDAMISVVRSNGADGSVSVKWRTIDKTAVNGKDYTGGEGTLEFKHGEVIIR